MVGLGLPIEAGLLHPREIVFVTDLVLLDLLPDLHEDITLMNVNGHERLEFGAVHLRMQIRETDPDQIGQHALEPYTPPINGDRRKGTQFQVTRGA